MSDVLSETECHHLYQAWHNFETVVKSLSISETKELLLLGCSDVLEALNSPPVYSVVIWAITCDVNSIIRNSHFELGLEDVLRQMNQAVILVCYPGIEESLN